MLCITDIRKKLCDCNQSHVLRFWDQLTQEEQDKFLKQLNTIDFDEINNIFNRAQTYLTDNTKKLDTHMKPIPPDQFESEKGVGQDVLEKYRVKGLQEVADNHVAVLLLAGGQGTRLGVPYPKGMCPISLPSGKTLLQLQAERIRTVVRLAREKTNKTGIICWYIMTSQATHIATEKYLQQNKYFGLNEKDVVLFQQGLLPGYTSEGKIILEEKYSVALAPDGNGGIYLALKKNGIIEDMVKRGIKYVHAHSVDNILVKVADPVFIGYCVTKDADCGAKVVRKEIPTEPVGVVCQVNGRFQVVEYSEITESTANLRDAEGNLVFRGGNICNHFFTTDFLKKIVEHHEHELKLHVARKKIPYVDEEGEKIEPTAPNGIKIEKFIFDAFQFSQNFVTWEVPRETDFSPLKNSETAEKDCPSTARRDLFSLHKIYIEIAGGTVAHGEVEISPVLSYAGENLKEKVHGKVFDSRTVIYSEEEVVVVSNGRISIETPEI
ncbi:hypothetical protein NQ314_007435 [Rhamnusium bicolor]|uniref:UDP-N-acetylglucosamine diphosphorylase n=1 Tax=Rhamnusium bicolor TaxID=1586634 RepID=A0AAV8YNS7_9CUCU|nr:hypothetical protein NQ314_007435 [Rhamnusium bicolor]